MEVFVSQDLTAVKLSMLVFWFVKSFGPLGRQFRPDYGCSMFLGNTGIYTQVHTALQPRRLTTIFNSHFTGYVKTEQ
jgi:hypothetical protein